MENSFEGFDTGIMKQLSAIEEKCGQSSSEIEHRLSGNLEDYQMNLLPPGDVLKGFSLEPDSKEVNELSFERFIEDLKNIKGALKDINRQIEVKKSQQVAFECRIERLVQDIVENEEKIDEACEELLGLELKEKDVGVACECFCKFFGDAEVVDELQRALRYKAAMIENKVNLVKGGALRPRKSKDDEKLVLTVKNLKSRG